MTPDEAALWQTIAACVQAVGSLIAIGVAIAIPVRLFKNQLRLQQSEKEGSTRTHAIIIRDVFYRVKSAVFHNFETTNKFSDATGNLVPNVRSIPIREYLLEIRNADVQFDTITLQQIQNLILDSETHNFYVSVCLGEQPNKDVSSRAEILQKLISSAKKCCTSCKALEARYQELTTNLTLPVRSKT